MKRLATILTLLCFVLSLCIGGITSAENSSSTYGYLVGIGDSWTNGMGATNVSTENFVKVAADTLGWQYYNGGVSGWYVDNTANSIKPSTEAGGVDATHAAMVDADVIVCHAGTNDFCSTTYYIDMVKAGNTTFDAQFSALKNVYISRIKGIVDYIKSYNPDALILMANMWCSYEETFSDRLSEITDETTDDELTEIYEDTYNYYRLMYTKLANEELAALADTYDNYVLFDVDSAIGVAPTEYTATENISNRHPTTAGYKAMADEAVSLIRTFYGEESPTFVHTATTVSDATTAQIEEKTTTTTTTTTEAATEATPSEGDYKYVSVSDFEDGTYSSFSKEWFGGLSVVEDSTYANPETGSTKVLKATCNNIGYDDRNSAFVKMTFDEAALKDSYGFRFWFDGDDAVTGQLLMRYSVTVNGTQENYKTDNGSTADGHWVTVMWGDVDLDGVKWYHDGNSNWHNEVLSRDVMASLTTLTVNLNSTVTSAAQNYYIDDVQMIYAADAEVETSSTEPTEETTSTTTTVAGSTDEKYLTVEDFEDGTYSSFSKEWFGGLSVVEDSTYANPETGSTKVLKATCNNIGYDDQNSAFVKMTFDEVALKDSYGFRFWLDGDDAVTGKLLMRYSVTVNGTQENYKTTVGADANGQWVTVMWGDVDLDGLKWYHDGDSNWHNEVLSRDVMASLTTLTVNLNSTVTSAAQNYYIDDVQMIRAAEEEETTTTTVTEPVKANTTDAIATKDGASIRLNIVNGMRFYTTVDTDKLSALVGDADYEIGTLIGPEDLIGDELTADDLEDNAVIVPYVTSELWDGNDFVGSIVGIQNKNYTRNFVARGYVKVGDTYYYSATTCTRNIATIADAYIADGNSGYASLNADVKAVVDAWAKANG